MTPSPAITEMIQARIESGMLVVTPNASCAQISPMAASQIRTRYNPNPISTISSKASPIAFSSTVRNCGENIWDKALPAASSMGTSARMAEVEMPVARHKPHARARLRQACG